MRNRLLFFGIVLTVLATVNYYIGRQTWQWLQSVVPGGASPWLYWPMFWVVALGFLGARLFGRRLPRLLGEGLSLVGAVWFAVMLYALPLLLLVELFRLGASFGLWTPPPGFAAAAGGGLLALLAGTILYGFWRARNPVVTRYEIEVAKSGGNHQELHVLLVSDTHYGAIVGSSHLNTMLRMVSDLKPDLLLLAGDIIDDHPGPFIARRMGERLQELKPRLGTYAVLGNHEYIGGHAAECIQELERSGVRVLVDEWVKVDESFYVIGRDDWSGRAFTGRPRKPLAELLEGVDRRQPLLLMDHQPHRLEEAEQAGVDLQVSGHTHRGQLFPNHLLTRRIFELDWGYLKKGALHVVVSLGFGTWGPPVRIGNRPELVSIRVRFTGA